VPGKVLAEDLLGAEITPVEADDQIVKVLGEFLLPQVAAVGKTVLGSEQEEGKLFGDAGNMLGTETQAQKVDIGRIGD
jgi:hypothetical protein